MAPVIHRMSHTVQSLYLNDNLMMLVHTTPNNSRVIAMYLRKHNFVPPDLDSALRNIVRKWMGSFEYARAYRKPQEFFDDILSHLAPPLPAEVASPYEGKDTTYKGAFNSNGTNPSINLPGQLPRPRGGNTTHSERLEEPATRAR
jgi:hypothetical protein